ncbi:MAG: (Fe-S)-binding protein [Candidatus Thorarchaeota archaeon]
MSSIWTRSLKASPQYDCGLCGYPKCSSFTRAAIVDFTSIEKCPLLSLPSFKKERMDLLTLISRKTGLRFRTATELPEGGVVLTRPCKDTDQKVMAELRVHNGVEPGDRINFGVFDPILLCDLSDCLSSEFDEVKCSRDLGYGRADTGEMSITLLQDGRVNMRRVDSKEQVLKVFDKIERAILGSTMCNCCGNDLISIVSGLVSHQDAHTVLQCGSSIKLDCEMLKPKLTGGLLDQVFDTPEIRSLFDETAEAMLKMLESLSASNLQTVFHVSSDLRCKLISLVLEKDDKHRQTVLLRMLGFEWILQSSLHALEQLHQLVEDLPSSEIDMSDQIIRTAASGQVPVVPPIGKECLYKIFALSNCLVRGRTAIDEWLSG